MALSSSICVKLLIVELVWHALLVGKLGACRILELHALQAFYML